MLRRGDVQPGKKIVGANLSQLSRLNFKAFTSLVERHQIQTVLEDTDTTGIDEFVNDSDVIPRENPLRIESDTGEMWRDLKRSIGAVDSPRTKIVYGMLGRFQGEDTRRREPLGLDLKLNGMTVDCFTDFGVVALSSLTDDSIETSEHMLLTTIGRARNTDQVYDGDKMIDYGKAPIMSEVINATITLKTQRTDLKVWGVNPEGFYVGQVPAKFEDGNMTFTLGEKFPASYYLIVAE